jgi:hypothetical protein
MGFEIKSLPQKEVEGSGVFCNWNAVHNPIIFEFERKDYLINSVANNGGFVELTMLTPYNLTEMLEGDFIGLFTDVYNGSFEVTNVISNTVLVLDLAYVSGASGYIILNKRKNYYLSSQIRWNNPATDTFETIATSINQADTNNVVKLNAAPYLKKKIVYIDSYNYQGLNQKRTEYSGKFSLIVTEYFNNDNQITFNEAIIGDWFYLNSARQIQQRYGSNLAENFTLIWNYGYPAKFLSAFKKPTYFKGFPFCLNFILNDTASTSDLGIRFEGLDLAGIQVFARFYALDFSQGFYLNSVTILPNETDLIDSNSIIVNLQNFLEITEVFAINYDKKCKDNPICLNWLGTDGSRNVWVFERLQTIGIDVQLNASYEKYIDDLETSQGSIVDLERTAKPSISMGGQIEIENIEGLKTLLYSIDVLMLVNPTTWQSEGVKWQKVRVVPASFKLYDTDQTTAEFQLTIQLENINIQTQ